MTSPPNHTPETPPAEWLAGQLTDDGQITFCPSCRIVPAVPLGHGCACGLDRLLAYAHDLITPWAIEAVEIERLYAIPSESPDGWYCYYREAPAAAAS